LEKHLLYKIAERLTETVVPFSVVDSHQGFIDSSDHLYEESLESGKIDQEKYHNRDNKSSTESYDNVDVSSGVASHVRSSIHREIKWNSAPKNR